MPFLQPGRPRGILSGLALALIAGGAGFLLTGPEAQSGPVPGAGAPEVVAYWHIARHIPALATDIRGPRLVIGDGMVRRWIGPETVFAIDRATSAEIQGAVAELDRAGPVRELVLWLGTHNLARTGTPGDLAGDIRAILAVVQPERYVIVAPLPLWTSPVSVNVYGTANRKLAEQFPGHVIDPFPVLQAAMAQRAPVYYDGEALTIVGYDHITNMVNRALGSDEPPLPLTHGIAEYGRMRTPMPAGVSRRGDPRRG